MLPFTQLRTLPPRNTHPPRHTHRFYTNTSAPGPSIPINILKFSKEELREDLRLTFNLTSQEWVHSSRAPLLDADSSSPNLCFYPWLFRSSRVCIFLWKSIYYYGNNTSKLLKDWRGRIALVLHPKIAERYTIDDGFTKWVLSIIFYKDDKDNY